jgi:ubiquitin-protein ligase E3 C
MFNQVNNKAVVCGSHTFLQDELQHIISGSNGGIDIEDLKRNTNYSGGYHSSHVVIGRFWRVLASLDPENQRRFLAFVTSCSRPPLLGFAHLQPRFCIHMARHHQGWGNTSDDEYLPTASTCMNFLKLPPYSSEEKMREKLLYAIQAKAGNFLFPFLNSNEQIQGFELS